MCNVIPIGHARLAAFMPISLVYPIGHFLGHHVMHDLLSITDDVLLRPTAHLHAMHGNDGVACTEYLWRLHRVQMSGVRLECVGQ